MSLIEKVQTYFEELDSATFKKYSIIGSCLYAALIIFFLYYHISSVSALRKKMAALNVKREKMQEVLARYETVKNQKAEVNKLLEKDTTFKIGSAFATITNNLNISSQKSREPEISQEPLDNGYTEVKLYASFSNLDIKKIATLLDTLEQNERIHTKEVEIYKPNGSSALNLNLTIATLEPKTETETME